jgi:hypothetical protein
VLPVNPVFSCAFTRGVVSATLALLAAAGCAHAPAKAPVTAAQAAAAPDVGARSTEFQVVEVRDDLDPFLTINDDDIPERTTIYREYVPLGPDVIEARYYARTVLVEGEAFSASRARIKPWLDSIPIGQGARWGFERVTAVDPDRGTVIPVGIRTYLLSVTPIVTERDLASAEAMRDPSGTYFVLAEFTPDGAARFQAATRASTSRRLAIVIEGYVTAAPVVKREIRAGRLGISVEGDTPEVQRRKAEKLARGLMGR